MEKDIRIACNEFDEAFEEALGELLASGVSEEEIRVYFGPSALGHYIIERMRADE